MHWLLAIGIPISFRIPPSVKIMATKDIDIVKMLRGNLMFEGQFV